MSPPAEPPEPRDDGRRAIGRTGEHLAAAWLSAQGYRIEARNLRTRFGEVDLLVRRRRTWIAVEVKSRRRHPAPERCVSAAQRARLGSALLALAPTLRPRPRCLRVDVVAIVLGGDVRPDIRHFPGAPFRA